MTTGAVDPTYPLYPVVCTLAATLLIFVLLTSFIRQNCNLGVAFLCFWLILENLALGVDAVLWSDNADVRLHVYCDIGTRSRLLALNTRALLKHQQYHISGSRLTSSSL